jgi:hypothetical protein
MVSLGESFKFEVSSKRGRGPHDYGLGIERRRLWAGAGGKMRETNPIWPGWRVNAQKPISASRARCRAGTPDPFDYRSGRALRRAESCETNPISPRGRRLTQGIVQNEPNLARLLAGTGGEMRKTKPNLGELGYVGKGGCRVGHGSAGE